jgi:hypothetical protein
MLIFTYARMRINVISSELSEMNSDFVNAHLVDNFTALLAGKLLLR